MPVCVKMGKMAQPVPTKAFLQPAKTTAMCTACHDYACPPPPYPHFFASAKPTFKTDRAN